WSPLGAGLGGDAGLSTVETWDRDGDGPLPPQLLVGRMLWNGSAWQSVGDSFAYKWSHVWRPGAPNTPEFILQQSPGFGGGFTGMYLTEFGPRPTAVFTLQ